MAINEALFVHVHCKGELPKRELASRCVYTLYITYVHGLIDKPVRYGDLAYVFLALDCARARIVFVNKAIKRLRGIGNVAARVEIQISLHVCRVCVIGKNANFFFFFSRLVEKHGGVYCINVVGFN